MTLRALTALVGSLLLAACVRHDESTLPGTLERDRVELVADASEAIVSLPFAEGATVKAGDVVVVQDRELSASRLDAARADLAGAEARVEELKNGPRSTTIRAAIARRDNARAQRDSAVRERDRLLGLVARSLVSKQEADRQSAVADAAEASLREAEADLRELQEGTRAEQVAQANQAADIARATLKGLSGADFDKAYVNAEVDLHQAVLDQLDNTLIPSAQNAELKSLLEQARPTISAHLDHAKSLKSKLGA